MIKILCIETSESICSVAISVDGVCQNMQMVQEENSHARKITLLIQEVLANENLKVKDLDAVCVSSGPGSYTGLRIGVSTAKGICWAAELKLLSLTSTEILVEEAKRKTDSSFDIYVAALDARRNEIFYSVHSEEKEIVETIPLVLEENPLTEWSTKKIFVAGTGAFKLESFLKVNDLWDGEVLPNAKAMCKLAYHKFLRNEVEDVAYFEPKYFKAVHTSKSTKKIF